MSNMQKERALKRQKENTAEADVERITRGEYVQSTKSIDGVAWRGTNHGNAQGGLSTAAASETCQGAVRARRGGGRVPMFDPRVGRRPAGRSAGRAGRGRHLLGAGGRSVSR